MTYLQQLLKEARLKGYGQGLSTGLLLGLIGIIFTIIIMILNNINNL
jgi:hypothetical protein